MPELRAEVAGLKAELGECVRGRPHDIAGAVEEINQIGVVVHAIEDEVVLLSTLAVRYEVAAAAAARISQSGRNTRRQLGDVNPVAAIERCIVDYLCTDNLTDTAALRLKQR